MKRLLTAISFIFYFFTCNAQLNYNDNLYFYSYNNVFRVIVHTGSFSSASVTNLTSVRKSATIVNLSWDFNLLSETGYVIERSTNGVDYSAIGTSDKWIKKYTDNTASGDIYYYKVRANQNEIYSPYSNVSTMIVPLLLFDNNTVCWYDYTDLGTISMNGSNLVAVWFNKINPERRLIQMTDSFKPLYTANGILFDGVDNYLKTSGFTFIQPEYIYIVIKQVTWTNGKYTIDGNTLATGILQQSGTTPNLRVYAGTASGENNGLALNTYGIVRVLFNGASSSLQVNANAATTGNFGVVNMSGFTLGAGGSGTANWSNIEVKEVILRRVADNSTNSDLIYNYLKTKYSL